MHAQTPPPTKDSALRGTLENIQSNLLSWPWREPVLGDHERIGVLLPEVPLAKRTVTIQTRDIRIPPCPVHYLEPHPSTALGTNVRNFSRGYSPNQRKCPALIRQILQKKAHRLRRFLSVCSFAEVTRRAGEFSQDVTPGSPHPRMQEGLHKSDLRQEFRQAPPAISCSVAKRLEWVGKANSHIFPTYQHSYAFAPPPPQGLGFLKNRI